MFNRKLFNLVILKYNQVYYVMKKIYIDNY